MIGLITTYAVSIAAFLFIVRLVTKCTTTQQQDKPQQTEPSHTGRTPITFRQSLDEWEGEYRRQHELKSPHKID